MTRPRRARVTVPKEHDEQVRFFELVAFHTPRYPELACVYAVPNFSGFHGGTVARLRSGSRAKAEGRRAGVPDINCDVARDGLHGLRIELKRVNSPPSAVSPDQREWHIRLMEQGYRVVVARGHAEAWGALCAYLFIPNVLENERAA